MKRTMHTFLWSYGGFAAAICLILNLAVLIGTALNRSKYLIDYRENLNPDAVHYVLLGRNFLQLGEYSRCSEPPYVPDILRTPVYPLFAGGLDVLGGPVAIYVTQALLHVGSCVLLFLLVRQYFGDRAAFWASLLLATDLMLVISNFEAMSEPLFSFLLVASAYWLFPAVIPSVQSHPKVRDYVIGGLLLSLAILTRPAGLYVPFIYAALLLCRGLYCWCMPQALMFATLLLLTALLPVAAWIARNHAVFSVAHLSNSDAIMLVYFTGAGAYQIEHGMSLEEAQLAIGQEFNLPPPVQTNNHWRAARTVAEMDAELRAAIGPVLRKYPISLLISSSMGVMKATFAHNVSVLASLVGSQWVAPSTAGLLHGGRAAYDRLGQNGPLLATAFCWQLAHSLLASVFFLVGAIVGLRQKSFRGITLGLLLMLSYFLLTVALVGLEAFWRSRTPHLPLVYALAGVGLGYCLVPRSSTNLSCEPSADRLLKVS